MPINKQFNVNNKAITVTSMDLDNSNYRHSMSLSSNMLFRQQQSFLMKNDTEKMVKVKQENFKIKDNNFSIEAYEKHL